MLKQLINWANKLDKLGHTSIADEIDALIKEAQFYDARIKQHDFNQAIEFYNNVNINEIDPNNLLFNNISMMKPENFIPELNTNDKGWLKDYPIEEWNKQMTDKHGRNFTHIINMYKADKMNPAIQINDTFADGLARAIFYNAIGEDMPVASFTSQ